MRLLLDEMYTPAVAAALVEKCLDVWSVAADTNLRGTTDADLLVYATAQQQVLVTENVADFIPIANTWVSEGRAHAGLIFTNPKRFNRAARTYPGNLVTALHEFLDDPPVQGESWIWWLT